jgi:hypothetical protein
VCVDLGGRRIIKKYQFLDQKSFDFFTMFELPEAPGPLLALLGNNTKRKSREANISRDALVPDSEIQGVCAALSHIDPDIAYPDWISVLMSLHSLGNDSIVYSIADQWSSLGGKYTAEGPGSVKEKWDSFHRTLIDDSVTTIGTLYHLAKAAGWSGRSDDVGKYAPEQQIGAQSLSATLSGVTPLTEILSKSFPPLRYIIEGLLPDSGLYILSSNPKAGKTTLVHQACLSLLMEAPFLGSQHDRCSKILFLALEDSQRRFQHRTESIIASSEFDFSGETGVLAGFLVQTEWPQPPCGLEQLDAFLAENPDTDLVVIDTLAAFRRMPENSSNIYQQDYEMMRAIKRVADRNNVCILILHHNRKAQADDPGAAIGGTYGLIGAADGYLVLTKQGFADGQFVLAAQGREIAPTELALRRDEFAFRSLGDAQIHRMSPERQEIIELLEWMCGPLAAQEIADSLKRSGPATRLLLTKMYNQGQLHKPKTGHYCLPSQADTAD